MTGERRRRAHRTAPPLGILTVCTGNICRSPLAEQLLRQRLAGDFRYELASAGLNAVVGAPMDPMAAEQLRVYGGDPHGLVGEQLDGVRVDASDLLLTMTRGQRDHLIRRYPRAAQRTFTLAEFAALAPAAVQAAGRASAGGARPERPEAQGVVEAAARNRFSAQLTDADDVEDPINASPEVHARVASQIAGLVEAISTDLRALPASA
ncbi:low molecular weight phosphatase family protein [Brevibacterium album]|uniref:arsenate reductase/protein-tyrosine-phosphatase family protein n=1 Tax=Brevibacterium album TaxID=417948 RepID=UPI00040DA112|nr:low molecular weight phosphatase family protein [Brevibacterium album]